jgi:hypothetical protein
MTNTARLAIPELAASELVSEGPTKINSALTTIDNINRGDHDFLQAGCVVSTDWSLTGNINSSTGALGSTGNTGGTAWLPDPVISGALMRSVTTPATLSGIAPSLLPASTKFVSVAYELTPSTWGAKATVTAHSGVEKATEAEAIAAPPGTTAGKLQVRRVIVKNTAGVYSIVAQWDVRPWATGGNAPETTAEGKIGAEAVTKLKLAFQAVSKDKLSPALAAELAEALLPTSGYASLGTIVPLKNEVKAFPSTHTITVAPGQVLLITFGAEVEPSENEAKVTLNFNGEEIKFGATSPTIATYYQQAVTRRYTGLAGNYTVMGEAWASSAQGGASASVTWQLLNA